MPRLLLIQIALLFLPLAAALVWRRIRGQAGQPRLTAGRVMGLLLAGAALVILSFVVLASFGGGHDPASYRPAQFRDGVLVPAEVR